jgi:hypothetical protein
MTSHSVCKALGCWPLVQLIQNISSLRQNAAAKIGNLIEAEI